MCDNFSTNLICVRGYFHKITYNYSKRQKKLPGSEKRNRFLFNIGKFFLTQQYRLFSNYSASLQVDICYSDYTRIKVTMFGTRQLLFVGIRYVVDSPKPLPIWCCGKT